MSDVALSFQLKPTIAEAEPTLPPLQPQYPLTAFWPTTPLRPIPGEAAAVSPNYPGPTPLAQVKREVQQESALIEADKSRPLVERVLGDLKSLKGGIEGAVLGASVEELQRVASGQASLKEAAMTGLGALTGGTPAKAELPPHTGPMVDVSTSV